MNRFKCARVEFGTPADVVCCALVAVTANAVRAKKGELDQLWEKEPCL